MGHSEPKKAKKGSSTAGGEEAKIKMQNRSKSAPLHQPEAHAAIANDAAHAFKTKANVALLPTEAGAVTKGEKRKGPEAEAEEKKQPLSQKAGGGNKRSKVSAPTTGTVVSVVS